jgi:hypothetical protein
LVYKGGNGLDNNQFKCAVCGNVYEKGLTEDEALAQLNEEFGGIFTPDDCELVCDDCYNKMFK